MGDMRHRVAIENSIIYLRRSQLVAWCDTHCSGDFYIPNPDLMKDGPEYTGIDEDVLDGMDFLMNLGSLSGEGGSVRCSEPVMFEEEGDAIAFKMYMQNELQESAEILNEIFNG